MNAAANAGLVKGMTELGAGIAEGVEKYKKNKEESALLDGQAPALAGAVQRMAEGIKDEAGIARFKKYQADIAAMPTMSLAKKRAVASGIMAESSLYDKGQEQQMRQNQIDAYNQNVANQQAYTQSLGGPTTRDVQSQVLTSGLQDQSQFVNAPNQQLVQPDRTNFNLGLYGEKERQGTAMPLGLGSAQGAIYSQSQPAQQQQQAQPGFMNSLAAIQANRPQPSAAPIAQPQAAQVNPAAFAQQAQQPAAFDPSTILPSISRAFTQTKDNPYGTDYFSNAKQPISGPAPAQVAQQAAAVSAPAISQSQLPKPTASEASAGMVARGTVDLFNQPKVQNKNGTTSTVDSVGVNIGGKEYLLPTVTPDGRHFQGTLKEKAAQAKAEFNKTGQHLGVFDSVEASNKYAEKLHNDYAAGRYDKPSQGSQFDQSFNQNIDRVGETSKRTVTDKVDLTPNERYTNQLASYIAKGGQVTPELNAQLKKDAGVHADVDVKVKNIDGVTVITQNGEIKHVFPPALPKSATPGDILTAQRDFESRFVRVGNRSFQAPTPQEGIKMRSTIKDHDVISSGINQLISLADDPSVKIKFPPSDAYNSAKTISTMLQGALRTTITGPGAVNESEYKMLRDVIADPSSFFSLSSSNKKVLQTLLSRVDDNLNAEIKSLGGVDITGANIGSVNNSGSDQGTISYSTTGKRNK